MYDNSHKKACSSILEYQVPRKDTYSLPLGYGGPSWLHAIYSPDSGAHIKGWSYLSDNEVIITVWSLFRWGQKGGNEYYLIKCSLFYLNYMNIFI